MHHAIVVKDLHYAYPDGRQALKGVNLTVGPAEKVALVGPNGAGKSTLLLHLIGLLSGEGMVEVSGIDLANGDMARVRASVGMVFQNPDDQLFSTTVFEDVAFGPIHMGFPENEIKQLVDSSLEAVGMGGYGDRIPFHLSIGEKKRIAIASVLSMKPEILVLDEPTSGLDPRSRRSLIQLLDELDMTMLVCTHDMSLVAELLPQTAIMDGGRIVSVGPTAEILANQPFLEAHGLEMPCC